MAFNINKNRKKDYRYADQEMNKRRCQAEFPYLTYPEDEAE